MIILPIRRHPEEEMSRVRLPESGIGFTEDVTKCQERSFIPIDAIQISYQPSAWMTLDSDDDGDEGDSQTSVEGEEMSFKDKKKFFEQEIADQGSDKPKYKSERKFSYLSEHEVAKLRKEDEKKLSLTSQEELLCQMTETLSTDGDFNTKMTSLGGRGGPNVKKGTSGIRQQSVEKASNGDGRNANTQVATTNQQIVALQIQDGSKVANGGL